MDLETRLRETMDRHTDGIGMRSMPPGTVARVRRRRVFGLAVAAALVIGFVGGASGLIRVTLDRSASQPAAEGTASIPTPEPGVTFVTPAPFANLGPGGWPDVRAGGVEDPYIDREIGDDEVLTDKVVVASGYVEGVEWSMTAFAADHSGVGNIGWGTCAELFLGDLGDNGGVRLCTNVEGDPGQRDLRVAGTSFGSGPVTAYAGIVSDRVDSVVFELSDGSRTTADLANGPNAFDARYFVLWVPNDAAGTVSALDASGASIATEPLCVGAPVPQDEVTMCGNGAAWAASAVVAEPH
ncbi:MAG TPA: hypothetical protein VGL16_08695 [Actinomycetota bacterium]|jgi:hypothetical protein